MKIWNPTTDAYEQYGGSESISGLATELLADAAFVSALALKTNLSEFAYANYSPTVIQPGTITQSATIARYIQIDKWVHCFGVITVSSAGTTGNGVTVSLPTSPYAGSSPIPIGVGRIQDTGTTMYNCIAIFDGGGSNPMVFQSVNTAGETRVGISPAFALASGDKIFWDVTYEAA